MPCPGTETVERERTTRYYRTPRTKRREEKRIVGAMWRCGCRDTMGSCTKPASPPPLKAMKTPGVCKLHAGNNPLCTENVGLRCIGVQQHRVYFLLYPIRESDTHKGNVNVNGENGENGKKHVYNLHSFNDSLLPGFAYTVIARV